jgi:hypothetical protein
VLSAWLKAWFGSTADYDGQSARGLIACPLCGDADVAKAVMAPAVAAKGNRAAARSAANACSPHAELLAAQRRMEANSDCVGGAFAAEARSRHDEGQSDRPIYGEATHEEARALIDDGIPVLPLPFRPLIRSDA